MRMADKASNVDYPLGDIFHYSFIFKDAQVSRSSSQLSDNYSMDELTARGFPFSIIILEPLNAKQKQQRHHIFLSISNFFPNLC